MDYITIKQASTMTGISERMILRVVKKVLEGRYPIHYISTDVRDFRHLWVVDKEFILDYFQMHKEGAVAQELDENTDMTEFLLSRIDLKNDVISKMQEELDLSKERLRAARSRQMMLATPRATIKNNISQTPNRRRWNRKILKATVVAALFMVAFVLGQVVNSVMSDQSSQSTIAKDENTKSPSSNSTEIKQVATD